MALRHGPWPQGPEVGERAEVEGLQSMANKSKPAPGLLRNEATLRMGGNRSMTDEAASRRVPAKCAGDRCVG